MIDYLFNFLLLFSQYIPLLIILVILYLFSNKIANVVLKYVNGFDGEKGKTLSIPFAKGFRRGIGFIFVVALTYAIFATATSPSITYKHETHNDVREQKVIEQRIEENSQQDHEIVDRSLKPDDTKEERKKEFDDAVDWRNR